MRTKKVDNVNSFILYQTLVNANMRGPILIIYMTKLCGMTLPEVYFCEACCVIVSTILQIPTGALADKWGRVKTIRIGAAVLIAELVCFGLATDWKLIWLGNFLWAIGSSIISGADSAFIYDCLKEKNPNAINLENEYRGMIGKSNLYSSIITAIMCLACGFIASINMHLPIVVDVMVMMSTLMIAFKFKETTIHTHEKDKKGFGGHMIESIKNVINTKALLWIIAFSILISVTSKLWFFTYNPYFVLVELPLQYYGIVFCAFNIVNGVSSYYANRIANKIQESKSIVFCISMLTLPMIAMGFIISKWSISLILLQNVVRGYLNPLVGNMMNKRIDSAKRATVLSVKSALHQATEVLCMFFFGIVIKTVSLGWAISSLGMVSTLIGSILVIYYIKIFRK